METQVALIVGAVLLLCGCISFLIVRITNPIFQGLGWIAGAFACGSAAAGSLAFLYDRHPVFTMYTADTLILLAFVLVNIAVLELVHQHPPRPIFGFLTLPLQVILMAILEAMHQHHMAAVIPLGIAVALVSLHSASQLRRNIQPGLQAPAWLATAILLGLTGFNLARSFITWQLRHSLSPDGPNPWQFQSVVVFLGAALGIGFSTFWMISTRMRVLLEQAAYTDALTGILNRRSFEPCFQHELLRCSRTGEPLSMLLIDLDHFKEVNDHFGHESGDLVLQAVVERLRDSVRNIDVVARWGGEEFCALLPAANAEAAELVAQRIRRKVEGLKLPRPTPRRESSVSATEVISVTVSIGVTTYRGPEDSMEAMFRRCDAALYTAKAEGRNCVVSSSIHGAHVQTRAN
ncbi:MAG: GGDEF domain-containing protein [Acidobacteriota bacterium]|nr:GGDEF domain-containing protein [Acidobacteriota bacterium]